MNVLLCERSLDGHRKIYLEQLSSIPESVIYVYAPQNIGVKEGHYFKMEGTENLKSVKNYVLWINCIKEIVKCCEIDIVHILDGDGIMRYFGLGFLSWHVKKIVITYHHFFPGVIRKISYRFMNAGKNRVSVVHTESVRKRLVSIGIRNVVVCGYPGFKFSSIEELNAAKCKNLLGIPQNIATIGIIGGMAPYKNILFFLRVLRKCKLRFHILIAGKSNDWLFKDQLLDAIEPYKEKVTLIERKLTDNEYETAIAASNIIFCVYSREFDGASGLLIDGVCARKFILACKHGSLGEITSEYLLGLTAECDDEAEILNQTEIALSRAIEFKYSEIANQYRESLRPEAFLRKYAQIYRT
jgi:hypothetical protein|nr:hypothetical protein [uncultured Acetatifactor sp.]